MTPLAQAFVELWPYVAAFVLGCALPSRQGKAERIGLGLMGVLGVALVLGLWPGAAPAGQPPVEWPHLLNVIVFLPVVGAAALLLMPKESSGAMKAFTMVVLGLDLIASVALLRAPMTEGWHFQYVAEWLPTFGIRYHVAIDGVSLWLILLTTLTTPIAAYVSFGSIGVRIKELCFAILLLHGAMLGAFVALDLFLFYVFWELMLVPMVIFIGIWGGAEKVKAAYKFLLYTMTGSVFMLAAILYMVYTHKQLAGFMSFDYLALSRLVLPRTAAWLCFFAFTLAFAIKVPMWPLHTWLPDAHVQAPTGGSIILAAVLLKLGTYGYIRFCMGMFGGPAWASSATLAGFAVVGGILYGALVAWKQADVKRLVAYSSVAHMGFVMLGLFAATQASVEGSILQMINHGVSTGALFLLVGVIYDRRHTRLVSEFGGLAKVMPVYAAIFVVITLSSIGVPGTNGFVGEFMVIMGTFTSMTLGPNAHVQAIVATAGVILAAVYMLGVVQKMFFGPVTREENKALTDMNLRETIAVAPLLVLVFVIGLFPQIFLERMGPAVAATRDRLTEGRKAYLGQDEDSTQAFLLPLTGGALETGYPKNPAGDKGGQTLAVEPTGVELGAEPSPPALDELDAEEQAPGMQPPPQPAAAAEADPRSQRPIVPNPNQRGGVSPRAPAVHAPNPPAEARPAVPTEARPGSTPEEGAAQ